jgi:hypothetical protein
MQMRTGGRTRREEAERVFFFCQQPHALIAIVLGLQQPGKFLFFPCFAKLINLLLTHACNNGFFFKKN